MKAVLVHSPQNRGFVIVGVVMFVLALTILGLSLFSLSSYEAQFLTRSANQLQAVYHAQGALDRARYVLSIPPHRLDQVSQGMPPFITAIRALQVQRGDTISADTIQWGGEDIIIRATARYGNVTRTIEAFYEPTFVPDYYKRVVTAADRITVTQTAASTDRRYTVIMNNGILLGNRLSPDTSFTQWLLEYNPRFVQLARVPPPDIQTFASTHPTTKLPLRTGSSDVDYKFEVPEGQVGYYTWFESGQAFTLQENNKTELKVKGKAVWILDAGIRFNHQVKVRGDRNKDALVIVSGKNGRYEFNGVKYYDVGVWFHGGVETEIPLILVSNGAVYVEQVVINKDKDQKLHYLSIYANEVLVTGPIWKSGSPERLEMRYDASRMDVLIDWLYDKDALPNSGRTGGQFALIPGTWREISN